MPTQTLEQPILANCASCPYFRDFGEPNGRGWCRMFDQMARQHHNRTGACDQEFNAVEEVQQEPMRSTEAQSRQTGLAGDSISSQLRPAKEAPQQVTLASEPIHTSPSPEVKVGKPPAWSVTFNKNWGWYDVWVARHWCGRAATHEEAERMATKRIALDSMIEGQNRAVMASYALSPRW